MTGTQPTRSFADASAGPTARRDRSLRAVVLLVGVVLLLRVVYLVWFCRYDLVEDEAHYWLWSRYPDWSYYSKGPGVAWAIWLSTKLLGNAEWAVRLPTAIAGAIGALAAGALARDLVADAEDASGGALGRDGRRGARASPAAVGLAAALAYTLTPALQGASIVMTIDGSYVACWSVACWAFWRSLVRGQAKFWALVGGAMACGFLFKYTMLLLPPGLLAFAIVRRRRDHVRRGASGGVAWFAVGALLALAGLVPVVYWNARNGWPTVQHLLGHLGMAGGDMPVTAGEGSKWSPWWLPELIGEQLGMIGPWLALAGIGGWQAWRERSSGARAGGDESLRAGEGRLFLVLAAAPILIFYAIVALIAEPEGNWPMAACATLMPLAAWLGADALRQRDAARKRGEPPPWGRGVRLRVRLWRIGLWYGLVAALLVHKLDWFGDAAVALDKQAWFHNSYHRLLGRDPSKPDVRVRDPAGRLRGAREIAEHVAELLDGLERTEKVRPFVIAAHYGRASQIAYYLRDRPGLDVLCAMQQTGGRPSQFDFWPHTSLNRPDLLGRPAVIVTSIKPYMAAAWGTMFARVEPIPGEQLRGESKPDRSALLGFGWKGPPKVAPARNAAPGP